MSFFFFFNDTATTEIYTLSLHDALPISRVSSSVPESRFAHGTGAAVPGAVARGRDVLPSGKAPFLICLFGEFPFGTFLAEITRGTTIHDRRCGGILVSRNGGGRIPAGAERFASCGD